MSRSSRSKALERRNADPPPEPAAGTAWTWLLLLAPLLAVVASLTLSYLWNEDFWWYLISGREVLEQGGIPDRDPFLYTSGEGLAWVSHSWLWTVLVALVERLAGLGGVVVFHAVVAMALAALVYTAGRADRLGLANALLTLLFLVTIADRLCGKADVATWLMLALFFHLLERAEAFTWRRGLALVLLQVLWANLHGGYPLGVFIALCYSAGGWIEERLATKRGGSRPAAARPPLWLPAVLFVAAVTAVADPRMLGERLAPFGFVLGSEAFQPVGESGTLLILEWRSPFREGMTGRLPWLYLVAVAVGLAGFVAARRWRLPRLLFFAGMAVLGATAVRHLPGLALAAAVVTLANLEERRRSAPEPRRKAGWKTAARAARPRWGPAYPMAAGLLAVVLLAAAVALRLARPGFEGEPSDRFFTVRPAIACPGAASFVLAHDLPGPIFNDFQMGGYLGYRLHPQHRLFIDSRVLDPDLVVEYTKIVDSPAYWQRAEERWGFRTAILGNYSKTVRSALGATLLRDPRWRLVYVDPLAVVFVKDAPAVPSEARVMHAGTADGGGRLPFVDRPAFLPPLAALQRLFLTDFSANYLVEYLALLGQIGRPRDVLDLATRAIAVTPGEPLLHRQRCAAHLALGDARTAVEDCEVAFEGRPDDSQVVALYAMALHGSGERQRAIFLLERALREHRGDAALLGLLQRLRRAV